MAEQLSLRDRRAAVEHLQRLADEPSEHGALKACLLLEEAWKSVTAACWSLSRAARTRPEGWLGSGSPGG